MAEKSIKFLFLSFLILISCNSGKSVVNRSLNDLENQFLSLVPKLQDHSVLISDSKGTRTGVFLAGGLVITSSRKQDTTGDLISLDFTHSQQVQGAIVGNSHLITLIKLVSDVRGFEGLDFSPLQESKGLGLFVAFSDPNASRPSIRIIRDIERSKTEFLYDELDDGGAVFNLDGELCGIYNHSEKKIVNARQFRSSWNRFFGVDKF